MRSGWHSAVATRGCEQIEFVQAGNEADEVVLQGWVLQLVIRAQSPTPTSWRHAVDALGRSGRGSAGRRRSALGRCVCRILPRGNGKAARANVAGDYTTNGSPTRAAQPLTLTRRGWSWRMRYSRTIDGQAAGISGPMGEGRVVAADPIAPVAGWFALTGHRSSVAPGSSSWPSTQAAPRTPGHIRKSSSPWLGSLGCLSVLARDTALSNLAPRAMIPGESVPLAEPAQAVTQKWVDATAVRLGNPR